MFELLHISINHYGSHGHSDNHVNRVPIPTKTRPYEAIRHGPVRILMRNGQWLHEPELVKDPAKGGAARRTP